MTGTNKKPKFKKGEELYTILITETKAAMMIVE